MKYVTAAELKLSAEADESSDSSVFERLAEAASRMFDRAAGVADDFFKPYITGDPATDKLFRGNGTQYIQLSPYLPGSIESVKDVYGTAETIITADDYFEQDGFLVFGFYISDLWSFRYSPPQVKVTAKWGFATVPGDIQQAIIEQALFMWRRKDLAFTDMSGVSAAAIAQQLSPTFAYVANQYKTIYSGFFA